MEYIDKQFPLEYVENDWDNFLNKKSNGERVRYFKFYRLIHYDNTTEGCINAFKKLQVLSKELVKGVVDINYGRTFFNISYKVVDGFKYPYYNGYSYTYNEDYVKRYYPNTYIDCKLVCFNLKIASFTDDKEVRFAKVNSALTKVRDKDEYIKAHPLTDKFGVPIEIGDYVASGSGSGATIFKVSKLTPSTINYGVSPKGCIIVRAKDPNKKLGW